MFLILNKKAFTLVEMLVALAVSSIVIIATYASYDMVKTQYEKNVDIAQMHTSGRAIMRVIERDVRMAGFEYQSNNGTRVYGNISNPINIIDGGENGLDEIVIIYDRITDEAQQQAERIRITYSTAQWPTPGTVSRRGNRQRLYKQIDVIGRDGGVIEETGESELMADFVDDLQFYNINTISNFYVGYWDQNNVDIYNLVSETMEGTISNWFYTSALAFGPDGLLYSGSRGLGAGSVFVHDPSTRELVRTISGFAGSVDSLAFDSSGLLYVGYWDQNNVDIYNPVSETMEGTISNWFYTSALAFGPDGLLYSGSRGLGAGSVFVHDPSTRELVRTISGFAGSVDSLAFDSSGLLYVGYWDQNNVDIYNPVSETMEGTISNWFYTSALAFGPDGLLYSGSRGWGAGSVAVHDPSTRELVRAITGFEGPVDSLAFKNIAIGNESLVNIKLTLRSKNKHYSEDTSYTKEVNEEHHIGNYNFEFDDKYKRDVFFSTVAVRNMLL